MRLKWQRSSIEEVGKTIAQIRKERGLSQEQFGRKIGLNGQNISNWERGKQLPPLKQIQKIIDIYGASTESFKSILVKEYSRNLDMELGKNH